MSREAWNNIKNTKNFYVNTYRRGGTVLVYSILLNLIFSGLLYYLYFNQPSPDYYATYGGTPPAKLTPLGSPNYTSVPLLASYPDNENDNQKVIPQ